jgi:hypothetical protein
VDYTTLLAAVDFTDELVALGTVAVAVAALFLGIRGARVLLRFVRS